MWSAPTPSNPAAVSARLVPPIPSAEGRKERLGKWRLKRLNEERDRQEGLKVRRQKRVNEVRVSPLLFSFTRMWKKELLVQVVKREGKQVSRLGTDELRSWLSEHDTKVMPLDQLVAEAERRGSKNAQDKQRTQLLRFLRTFDCRQEKKRWEREKEEKALKRKRAEDEEKEEEEEDEEGEEGGEEEAEEGEDEEEVSE
jgi:hypothetical protein